MDGRTKTTGDFYRDEAARVVLEAARRTTAPLETVRPSAPSAPYIPLVLLDEPQRAPLTPQPAINQNGAVPADRLVATERLERQRPPMEVEDESDFSAGRIIAMVVLAPWYIAVAIGSVGIDVLFVKDLFGF